jgi:hypothetical protein
MDSDGHCEIYLPWSSYNRPHPQHFYTVYFDSPSPAAYEIAKKYHPGWWSLPAAAKTLHARNAHIILGDGLDDPVKFVSCWTKSGRVTGGTGQAIRMAEALGIPVFNFAVYTGQRIYDQIRSLK